MNEPKLKDHQLYLVTLPGSVNEYVTEATASLFSDMTVVTEIATKKRKKTRLRYLVLIHDQDFAQLSEHMQLLPTFSFKKHTAGSPRILRMDDDRPETWTFTKVYNYVGLIEKYKSLNSTFTAVPASRFPYIGYEAPEFRD